MTVAANFATAAAGLEALTLAALVRLHRHDHSRAVLTRAVSDMALDPRTVRLFVVYGTLGTLAILCLACAVALSDTMALPVRVPTYMALLGVLRFGVLAFPTDPPGGKPTRTGHLHIFFAVLTFSLAYMAIAASAPVVAVRPGVIGPLLGGLRWVVAAALAAVVVTMVPPLHRVFGVPERILLFCTALWFLLLGLDITLGG